MNRIRTSDDVAGDGVSTVASVEDGLNRVGVLSSRNQAENLNLSRVRGIFSGRLAFLAGEDRQLGEKEAGVQRSETSKIHLKHTKRQGHYI